MSDAPIFDQELTSLQAGRSAKGRRWAFIPYDQLSDAIGPLARWSPDEAGIVLAESRWYLTRRPYHRQKLALLMANMRHFALEQARRGALVRYIRTNDPHRVALSGLKVPVTMMEPAERELREELAPLVAEGRIVVEPHGGWLTTRDQFLRGASGKARHRMDGFYRHVRQETGILMDDFGKPEGGRFSFDGDNREPWPGTPAAPDPPVYTPDAVTAEVLESVERDYAHHPGKLDGSTLPATAADAERLWAWAKAECLTHFGEFEDAMSTASTGLFHTRLSPLINIHRLLPRTIIDEAVALPIPLNSKEGFVRQILGWREYVKHVHDVTDGFRRLPTGEVTVADLPGDGGMAQWSGSAWPAVAPLAGLDGGALPNLLSHNEPVPPAFWGAESGLNCLDVVVKSVWEEGWSHHITRLMVLSNIAALLGVSPRALTDWFWVAYSDAYDWVVEPNVLGMGTFAVGDLMTTKPYIAGSGYIQRMSNYCDGCQFSPTGNCPLRRLYWAYLAQHEEALSGNQRLSTIMSSLRKRKTADREKDLQTFVQVSLVLREGRRLDRSHTVA